MLELLIDVGFEICWTAEFVVVGSWVTVFYFED